MIEVKISAEPNARAEIIAPCTSATSSEPQLSGTLLQLDVSVAEPLFSEWL